MLLHDSQVCSIDGSWSPVKVLLYRNILEFIWERLSDIPPNSPLSSGDGDMTQLIILQTLSSLGSGTRYSPTVFLSFLSGHSFSVSYASLLYPLTKYCRPSSLYLSLLLLSLFILMTSSTPIFRVPFMCIWLTHFFTSSSDFFLELQTWIINCLLF